MLGWGLMADSISERMESLSLLIAEIFKFKVFSSLIGWLLVLSELSFAATRKLPDWLAVLVQT